MTDYAWIRVAQDAVVAVNNVAKALDHIATAIEESGK